MRALRLAGLVALLACACNDAAPPKSARSANSASASAGATSHSDSYAGSAACAECHAAEHAAWRKSDHAHALVFEAPDGALAALGAARAAVGVRDDEALDVWGWLGRDPLAQPLVEFEGGRYQPLPLGWDSRARRWVALDATAEAFVGGMRPAEWRSRDACANTQCLFCHTTAFARGYDARHGAGRETFASTRRATFASTWHEAGVGCEACHGPASAHVEWQRADGPGAARASDSKLVDPSLASLRAAKGAAQVDLCGACHARRAELAEGWHAGAALLDHFRPELPSSPAYHADGRVHGEDFEWGSFRQSAMHAAGVRCSDCHEPHGTGLRAEGNALCLRCHSDSFDAPSHTRHARGSAGAACSACHMPRTTYLELDARADHSFSVPRPLLEAELGVPSACAACHADRDAAWASDALADVRPEPEIVRASAAVKARSSPAERAARALRVVERAREVAALRRGERVGERTLAALVDRAEPAVWRAALAELAAPHAQRADVRAALVRSLGDADGLVREAAAAALAPAAPVELAALAELLSDPLAAVRGSAARALAGVADRFAPAQRSAFVRARDERLAALRLGADTADGGLALGTALEDFGDLAGARAAYERALAVDPQHSPVALNLGLVRAKLGDRDGARVALSQALGSDPNSGAAHFALGLWHAEAGQTEQAERLLERAVQLDPAFPRARLNLALLYAQTERPALAEPLLRAEWGERPTRDARDALAALLEQTGRAAEAAQLRAVVLER